MKPKQYEKAVAEFVRIDFPAPFYEVILDYRLPARKSQIKRQIDVAVFERGQTSPFLIVEAKRHARPINVGVAGSTVSMVQDVGSVPAIMISTNGFTRAAQNLLAADGIRHLTLSILQATALKWVPALKARFALDREFALVSAEFVEALRIANAQPFEDEVLPYEEWLAIIDTGLCVFPSQTRAILRSIARDHLNDGYRYNAIQLLAEENALSHNLLLNLLASETDPDVLELIHEHLQGL